jgi:hypothetical protein
MRNGRIKAAGVSARRRCKHSLTPSPLKDLLQSASDAFDQRRERQHDKYLKPIRASIPTEPRLGLFWFIAKNRNPSQFASLSRPFSDVSEIEGFKTLAEGHVDVWPAFQRVDQTLAPYEYEYFPRGRVNWRKEDNRWILVLDPKLNRSPFITYSVIAWKLPLNRLLVLSGSHYRSVARVGPPQQGNGAE